MEIIKSHDDDVKKRKTCEESCLISILPDDVLSVILSSLTLKEAARTSVVGRRWRYLWRFTSSPNLVFELQQKNNAEEEGPWKRIRQREGTDKFLNSVNQIMKLHQGVSVGELNIRFSDKYILLMPHGSHLNNTISNWLQFAMQKQVRGVELSSFGHDILVLRAPSLDNLPQTAGNLEYDFPNPDKFLSISRGMEPKRSSFLRSLKSLKLIYITIKDEMIEYLLSNCPCLEQLCIKGQQYLSHLNVNSPSLKSLSLCECWNLKILKISAENLVSFAYMGQYLPQELEFCFKNVPHLSEVIMNRDYMKSFIFQKHLHEMYYNQLEKLVLDLPAKVCVPQSTYRNFPRLTSLKQLDLIIRVRRDESIIFYVLWAMACPFVSTLSIQFFEEHRNVISRRRTKSRQKLLNSYRHEHLKLVKLIGFAAHPNYIEFALDLLQVAKSLDKLIINPENDLQRVAITEYHAMNIQTNLPLGAELVIQ